MSQALYARVRAYHQVAGDDYGSELSRRKKYQAVKELLPVKTGKSILDVGCGSRAFQKYVPRLYYTGIDLVEGTNVMDYELHHDYVVANGCVYKLDAERQAKELLHRCWTLADEAFVWTSLDARGCYREGELRLDPVEMFRWARRIAGTGQVKVDASYLPHDFCVAMYR